MNQQQKNEIETGYNRIHDLCSSSGVGNNRYVHLKALLNQFYSACVEMDYEGMITQGEYIYNELEDLGHFQLGQDFFWMLERIIKEELGINVDILVDY